ncbi:arsenate reductase family protein [Nitrospirillum sp. BR 11828]|uniref:arsenate reductase family protein n=1 Tax=Nitrospirillum sp. BR 11828 TaxID=3104325 RepID=UPI002ACA6C00|nr:arsenate reductase family protein [Nitrospirillum sp. BR 11828]MDZ5649883.1 arsenate reductase family protein [Nitrospirillum sp. BR 11828]
MSTVVFYEKPGCKTNARQRQALEAAGHTVVVRDLLTEPWTAERLRAFFGPSPVQSWFNPAAPAIKAGAIVPADLDGDAALRRMLADPLLIRRPLAEVEGQRLAGFEALRDRLGLPADRDSAPTGCSHPHSPCPTPGSANPGSTNP